MAIEESPLKIVIYQDRYEFYNPGLLRISKDEIYHGGYSNPRNSAIMQKKLFGDIYKFIFKCEYMDFNLIRGVFF